MAEKSKLSDEALIEVLRAEIENGEARIAQLEEAAAEAFEALRSGEIDAVNARVDFVRERGATIQHVETLRADIERLQRSIAAKQRAAATEAQREALRATGAEIERGLDLFVTAFTEFEAIERRRIALLTEIDSITGAVWARQRRLHLDGGPLRLDPCMLGLAGVWAGAVRRGEVRPGHPLAVPQHVPFMAGGAIPSPVAYATLQADQVREALGKKFKALGLSEADDAGVTA